MRYSLSLTFACLLLVRPMIVGAVGLDLPECARTCYDVSFNVQEQCEFAKNNCTCTASIANTDIQSCVVQACTVKEWLVAMNATDVICERPQRDEGYVLMKCATILGTLALLALLMRMFVAMRQHSFGYDDLFACLAGSMAVSHSIGLAISANIGLGRDVWVLTPDEITRVQKIAYICQNFYFWCSGFQKLCFLFLFLRIFPSEGARRCCYIGIALAVGYSAGFGVTMVFACWPISAFWTSWTMEKAPVYCINQNLFYYLAAAANISSDLIVALIPIPRLLKLNLTFPKKLMLLSVFGVGFIVIIISCVRVHTLTMYSSSMNPTYDTLACGIWSNVELNVGVICICTPVFRRFFAHTMPKFLSPAGEASSRDNEANMPNNRFSSAKKSSKKKNTLPDSLFATAITKTVDTRISSIKPEEDELELVKTEPDKAGDGSVWSAPSVTETSYRTQHPTALPKEW